MLDLLNQAAVWDAVGKIASALAVLAGLGWAVLRWVVPQYRNITQSWRKIATIAHELNPNGGVTLRDAVDRMEKQLTILLDQTHLLGEKQWAIVAAQSVPIFECDPEGRCVRANQSYLELLERPFEAVEGHGWLNAIFPPDRDSVTDWWEEAIAKGIAFDRSFRVTAPRSKRVYQVQCFATPVFSPARDVVLGWVGRYSSVQNLA